MWRSSGALAAILVVFILGMTTWDRVGVWSDDLALWTQAERLSPSLLRPHFNRRAAFVARGNWSEAIDECVIIHSLIGQGAGTPNEWAFAALACSQR